MSDKPQQNDIYYHFKHITENPSKNPYYRVYRIIGISVLATNDQYSPHVAYTSVWGNSYEKETYGADFFIRPLDEFLENVSRDGYSGPRFVKIKPENK